MKQTLQLEKDGIAVREEAETEAHRVVMMWTCTSIDFCQLRGVVWR